MGVGFGRWLINVRRRMPEAALPELRLRLASRFASELGAMAAVSSLEQVLAIFSGDTSLDMDAAPDCDAARASIAWPVPSGACATPAKARRAILLEVAPDKYMLALKNMMTLSIYSSFFVILEPAHRAR